MTTDEIVRNAIRYASNLSALPAVWAGRKTRPVLWLYALCSLSFDINSLVLKALHIKWRWASNLFFLFEFGIVCWFFVRDVLPGGYRRSVQFILSSVAVYFVLHTCLNSVFIANYADAAMFYSFFMLLSLYGLSKVIREIEFVMIEKNPLFIFCVAFLLYASGSFIIFLFENKLLIARRELIDGLWVYVRNPLNIVKNLLIAYGIVLVNKQKWPR